MDNKAYILSFDIGTTANKTCLFGIGDKISLIESDLCEYNLYMGEDGVAEEQRRW